MNSWTTAEHLKYFQRRPPAWLKSLQWVVGVSSLRKNADDTGLHSQGCSGNVQEGAPEGEEVFTLGSLESVVKYDILTVGPSCVFLCFLFFFYELSRASRTFMICCFMTLVASPAFGIKYLGGTKTTTQINLRY